MPYMIYQQYATDIKKAYDGDDTVASMHDQATQCREWLASLKMDPKLRDPLVEQVAWIEEAFRNLLVDQSDL
ncbi:MAG: hypothetical protein WA996_19670 [Candidatus Promineifilaceae bacterium]